MTWGGIEIARWPVTGCRRVIRLTHKPWCCRLTVTTGYVLWLVVNAVGSATTQRHLSVTWCCTRRFSNPIIQCINSVADGCWRMTSIGLMRTTFITMTAHFTAARRIYILQQTASVWEPIRLMIMHRKRWIPLCSVLRASSVYWTGNITMTSCTITATYTQKPLSYMNICISVQAAVSHWSTQQTLM